MHMSTGLGWGWIASPFRSCGELAMHQVWYGKGSPPRLVTKSLLQLSMVGPERLHMGFWPGAGFLRSVIQPGKIWKIFINEIVFRLVLKKVEECMPFGLGLREGGTREKALKQVA